MQSLLRIAAIFYQYLATFVGSLSNIQIGVAVEARKQGQGSAGRSQDIVPVIFKYIYCYADAFTQVQSDVGFLFLFPGNISILARRPSPREATAVLSASLLALNRVLSSFK